MWNAECKKNKVLTAISYLVFWYAKTVKIIVKCPGAMCPGGLKMVISLKLDSTPFDWKKRQYIAKL